MAVRKESERVQSPEMARTIGPRSRLRRPRVTFKFVPSPALVVHVLVSSVFESKYYDFGILLSSMNVCVLTDYRHRRFSSSIRKGR